MMYLKYRFGMAKGWYNDYETFLRDTEEKDQKQKDESSATQSNWNKS